MKRIFAWILLVVMLAGVLAGCGCQKRQDPTEPAGTTAPSVAADNTAIQDVIDYLKAIYKDDGAETHVDYQRFGIVRIAGVPYEVVWSVDVSEDLVKVVVNDDGTVTIDVNEKCEKATPYVLTATVTAEDGTTASHSWNYVLPEAVDMVSIVKAAYALANGQSMDYEVTLIGEITMINTPYSEEYKNITVTIAIEGAEDMPIECYRLKGDGVDELQIGDTITVTGTLKNYNGTIEFDAGCILEAVTPGERVKAPEDPKQIVDEAYALGANQSLKYEATLTGKITTIKDPYSDQYKNITVVMVVEGRENKPITCYRMKGAGADDLDVGDTITVRGYITNYVGSAGYSTIEFTAGCQLVSYENTGKEFIMPSTAAGIVNLAYSLKEGEALPEKATLTGVVTMVDTAYSSQYNNVTVTIVIGDMYEKPIVCFRMKGSGADIIDEGYTITVTGVLKNYYGKIEFDAGCSLDYYKAPPKPEGPTVSYEGKVVDAPKADTPYKLGLVQKNISGEPTLYFSGNVANTYYLSTSKDGAKAVDVMLKAANGGYHLAFTAKGGTTKYINMLQVTTDKLHTNLEISNTAKTVYTYDEALKTLTVKMPDGNTYYIGTYSEYTTLSASDVTKISSSFPIRFMELEVVSGPASMEEGVKQLKTDYPEGYGEDYALPTTIQVRDDVFTITWKVVTEDTKAVAIKDGKLVFERQVDEVPYTLVATLKKGEETIEFEWEHSVPRKPAAIEVVTNPEIGKPYRLALTQENLGGSVLFLTGKRDGNYFATSDKSYEGVNVYAEKAGNGIRVYFMDGETKTYVDMYEYQTDKIGVAFNTTLTETSAIYTIDKEYKALIATFDIAGTSESRYLGTYNEHSTMSSGKIFDGEIDGFPAMFVIVNEETPVTLNAAAQELKKGLPKTEGDIAETVKLPKEVVLNNNKFTVTWTVTPADSAAAKLVGDELVITRPTNGAATFTLKAVIKDAAGETKEVTWAYTVPDAADTELTIAEAIEMGLAMEHNTYTTLKYKVTGKITEVYNTQYGNMYIEDAEGNKLTVYGTYDADGTNRYDAMAEKPVAGDTITVYGIIGQYNGTAQMKNGWILEVVVGEHEPTEPTEPAEPEQPDGTVLTIPEALAMGAAKEHNTYTTNKFKVTGKITQVYNTQYGNMYIEDAEGNKLTVYGTFDATGDKRYDAMAEKPVAGDTITVYGIIGQYNGTPQMKNAWILEVVVGEHEPTEPPKPELPDGTVLTIPEALEMGAEKEHNTYTTNKFKVTGVITEVYNEQYGNMYIADAEGNKLTVYGTYDADGTNRYDAMANKPVAGDTITVYGIIGQYNGTPQMKNGWIVEHTAADPGTTEPTTPEVTEPDVTEPSTEATEPAEGNVLTIPEAIALGSAQASNAYTAEKYTVTGVVSGVSNSQYGNLYIKDAEGNSFLIYGTYSADGSVRYDALEVKPITGDTITVTGIIGNYNGTAQMKNGWILELVVGEHEQADPDGTVLTVEQAIAKGSAMSHNTYTSTKYKVTGVITEVYGEMYGNMYIADEAGNKLTIYGSYSADGSTRYDAMDVKPVAGDTITVLGVVGQYNGTAQIKNGWIVEHIPAGTVPDVTEPSTEVTEPSTEATEPSTEATEPSTEATEPVGENVLTIPEAIALGTAQESNAYTEEKYTVTGVVTGVSNSQYGNLYIKDAEGNSFLIYGTYSADGSVRYDALEVKPITGDTITVTGIIGNYNGTAQMKNGWILNLVVGEHEVVDPDGTVLTIDAASAKGAAMAHNTYTSTKYKVTGVITEVKSTTYGNMTIADDAGNTLFIYGTYSADGSARYDAMSAQPVVGDTVTILGIIGQYNGTPQMKNGWIVEHTPAGTPEGTEPSEPAPSNPTPSAGTYQKVTAENQFTTGTYVMTVSSGYAPGALDGTWVSAVKPTVNGDAVTDAAGGIWTLTVDGDTVKITDANGVSIKPKASNTNGIASGEFNWKWTFEEGVFTFAAEAETVTLASNATAGQDYTNKFRAYKNTTVTGANYLSEFTLYKLVNE